MTFELVRIERENAEGLDAVYKDVFSGHPWHEDMICANVLNRNSKRVCKVQYTTKRCDSHDHCSHGEAKNDCRNEYLGRQNFGEREGIVLLNGHMPELCPGCGDKLNLISFYPDFTNHRHLIEEAISKPSFIGYKLQSGAELIGFSWGYTVPEKNTESVRFELLSETFKREGIIAATTFYGAELGVVEQFQRRNLGAALSYVRLRDAQARGYETFITRTVNPAVHAIIEKAFSRKKGKHIIHDPVRCSDWFTWNFSDFNRDHVSEVLENTVGRDSGLIGA